MKLLKIVAKGVAWLWAIYAAVVLSLMVFGFLDLEPVTIAVLLAGIAMAIVIDDKIQEL